MREALRKKLSETKGAVNLGESLALRAVSLLLALILWITILGFKKEQLRKEVKFEPLVAPGMIITEKIPDFIQFTLSGPRVQLKDFAKKIQPIRPDLRRTKETAVPVQISEDLIGELPTGVRVLSFNPPSVLIRLEEISERYVPVRVSLRGLTPQGLELVRTQVIPPKIAVSGPKSLLNKLEYVETEGVDLGEIVESMEGIYAVEIDTSQGFRLSRERVVRVEFFVRRKK